MPRHFILNDEAFLVKCPFIKKKCRSIIFKSRRVKFRQ